MYSDVVNEFFVKRQTGARRILSYLCITLLVALLVLILLFVGLMVDVLFSVALIASVGVVALGFVFIRRMNVEYEYSFITGDISVDKILNRTNRKSLFKFDVKNTEKIGIYNSAEFDKSKYAAIYNVTDSEKPEGCIYMVVASNNFNPGGKKKIGHGNVLILVQNDERVKKAVKQYVKAMVYREGMKNAN